MFSTKFYQKMKYIKRVQRAKEEGVLELGTGNKLKIVQTSKARREISYK